ncbi:Synaptophysin/synaptoporin family protein [Aphelenchoides bicaudatus]|nr:Synaptophysin/synaptoporin family protein [Aphelenchoides bicaudatus]
MCFLDRPLVGIKQNCGSCLSRHNCSIGQGVFWVFFAKVFSDMDNRGKQSISSTQQPVDCNPAPDISYFVTLDGLLKCLAIILNFLCFLCISVGGDYMGIGWSTFVVVIGFTLSLLFFLLYLFHLAENFDKVPWTMAEMIFCFIWTIFYFITASALGVAATQNQIGTFGWAAAAFFGFCAMIVYGLNAYLKFETWRHDEPDIDENV